MTPKTDIEVLREAVDAHKSYAAERPWMEKPNPIVVDVKGIECLLDQHAKAIKLLREANLTLDYYALAKDGYAASTTRDRVQAFLSELTTPSDK